MIDVIALEKAYAYAESCMEYISNPKDMRNVVQEVILTVEPYIRRDAVLEASENIVLPDRHSAARFSAQAYLSAYASKVFREATEDDLPDEAREEAEALERLASALESALKLPGGDERSRELTGRWIDRLYVRAHNLRGCRECAE